LTDLDGDAVALDEFHRAHATVELDIRDLKEGAGLEHLPSGSFDANSAWLQCAVLAHNLTRWTVTIGEPAPVTQRTVARTVRFKLINLPARLVNHAGTPTLRAPLYWPWQEWFNRRLDTLRALQPQPARSRIPREGAPPTTTGADNQPKPRTVDRTRARAKRDHDAGSPGLIQTGRTT
jgi:hypothetical protein